MTCLKRTSHLFGERWITWLKKMNNLRVFVLLRCICFRSLCPTCCKRVFCFVSFDIFPKHMPPCRRQFSISISSVLFRSLCPHAAGVFWFAQFFVFRSLCPHAASVFFCFASLYTFPKPMPHAAGVFCFA